MTVFHVNGCEDLYRDLKREDLSLPVLRASVAQISHAVAKTVREQLGDDSGYAPTLCVFILRGAALMLPGFLEQMGGAPFWLVAARRDARSGKPLITYASDMPPGWFANVVYVDCVVASGETVRLVRSIVRGKMSPLYEVVATICSASDTTDMLDAEGLDVVGVSLQEVVEEGLLTPDLGNLDAGDIFSGNLAGRAV